MFKGLKPKETVEVGTNLRLRTQERIYAMAIARCPQCGEIFHLRFTTVEASEKWKRQQEASLEERLATCLCFKCWKARKERLEAAGPS